LGLPAAGFAPNDVLLRQLRQQMPEAVLLALPGAGAGSEAALALIAWLRAEMALTAIMVVGPMDPPQLIVQAMRAGASEYLETPLRLAGLNEALARALAGRQPAGQAGTRGKLIAVLGARGGCGATTIAVNLAVALQGLRRDSDGPVALLDAAPLGHASLHLNLKPQFTLTDLLGHAQRLDTTLLDSLMQRHETGLELLAGASEPLPPQPDSVHTAWIEQLLRSYPLVVADLDGLTRLVLEQADRILLVTQTDMVSLWSAAKVRQYLDPQRRLRFELVLNRFNATPEVNLPGLETLTHTPLLWKLPNAHALVMEAIERGQPPAAHPDSDLGRQFGELAAALLGRPEKKRSARNWLPFLRVREVEN